MSSADTGVTPAPDRAAACREILRSRRTVHDFLAETVPEPLLLRALETARWAPNHHRTEPWRFYLLGEAARARICALNTALVREAKGEKAAEVKHRRWTEMPGWLVLTCARSEDPVREREDYAACCCAAQNMMLYLWSEGVGVKWTTGAVTGLDAFYAAAEIPFEREFVVGLFWYGWPAGITEQRRRPVDDIVRRID